MTRSTDPTTNRPGDVRRAIRERLARECDVTFIRAGGPGGQHRNKTESGVRLVHRPTGIVVEATERRSQAQNRSVALDRLQRILKERQRARKARIATSTPRGAIERRLEEKARRSRKKALRHGPRRDE